MTDLRSAMNDYLAVRRQLGFELKGPGRRLEDFILFMQRVGAEHVTTELALGWATCRVQGTRIRAVGASGWSAASPGT